MTKGEKAIWAAAYATEWVTQYRDVQRGHRRELYVPGCVENAAAAVIDARESRQRVAEAFGDQDDVFLMLLEALK